MGTTRLFFCGSCSARAQGGLALDQGVGQATEQAIPGPRRRPGLAACVCVCVGVYQQQDLERRIELAKLENAVVAFCWGAIKVDTLD